LSSASNSSRVIPSPLMIAAIGMGVSVGGTGEDVLVGIEDTSGVSATAVVVCSIPQAEIIDKDIKNKPRMVRGNISDKLY
jgi:hypothetical protein